MKKKIISVLTSAVCAIGAFGGLSFDVSADVATYGVLTYENVDDNADGYIDYVSIIGCDKSVTDVGVPSSINGIAVRTIGASAFEDCRALKSVIVPDTVLAIRENAFKYCTELSSVTLGSGLNIIADQAFMFCKKLESISLPVGLQLIAFEAFSCTGLNSVTIPETVTEIGAYAFHNSSVGSANIPASVALVGRGAFENTPVLENQEGLEYIDSWLLGADYGLTHADVKDGTLHIGVSAFEYCPTIKSVRLPEGLLSIEGWAFSDCSLLEKVTVPSSVRKIDWYAFDDCSKLMSITINGLSCEIYDASRTINNVSTAWDGEFYGTIYGFSDSSAQVYANKYGFYFSPFGGQMKGDLSYNDNIDLYDAIETAKVVMGMRTLTEQEAVIADFDRSGTVDLYDTIMLARFILGVWE